MNNVQQRLEKMMIDSGAYLKGHFLLTSGKHSGHYMQCAMMLRYPENAAYAGGQIASALAGRDIDFVASPAVGGLIIGHEVARALGVPFLFCEREEGKMVLRRFPVPEGKRFVVVEDVITTGGSAEEVRVYLESAGCIWEDTCCVVDRSGDNHKLQRDPLSLWKVCFPVYSPEACPLCSDGSKPYKPGSRNS